MLFNLLVWKQHTSNTQELYSDGLVQDCNNSIVNALELLKSYVEPST